MDVYKNETARSLLRAVFDAPGDDTPRLVLADWLDENGFSGRARKIRRGVAHPHQTTHSQTWVKEPDDSARAHYLDRTVHLTWRRGFVERVEATPWGFYHAAKTLFWNHPVTAVTLKYNVGRSTPYLSPNGYHWFAGPDFYGANGSTAEAMQIRADWSWAYVARVPDYLVPYMPADSPRGYTGRRFQIHGDPDGTFGFPARQWGWGLPGHAIDAFNEACRKFGRVRAGIDPDPAGAA